MLYNQELIDNFNYSIILLNNSIFYLSESLDELNLTSAKFLQSKSLSNEEQLLVLKRLELGVIKYSINLEIFYIKLNITEKYASDIIANYNDLTNYILEYKEYNPEITKIFIKTNNIELVTSYEHNPNNINKVMQQYKIINHLYEKNLKIINVDLNELNFPLNELSKLIFKLNKI